MNILVVVILILLIIVAFAALKAKQSSKFEGLVFDSRGALFTTAERSFLGVLEQVIDDRYRVFGKVRLGDIVKPAKGLSKSRRTTALNKINQKHVDFVLCSATDLAVIGVIELDDQSHTREDRTERDVFVDRSLRDAKIAVARFSAKKGYAIQEVRAKLVEQFNLATKPLAPTTATQDISPVTGIRLATNAQICSQPEAVVPTCQKCSAVMVKRQAKSGANAGRFFWACSTYPKCRQVVPIEEP
jgi:hypothetical protein